MITSVAGAPSVVLDSTRFKSETVSQISASSADIRLLNIMMLRTHAWPRGEEITNNQDSGLDGVIDKPWGHEYRVYRDPFYDVWHLMIDSGCSTSEHCHPRKLTALVCLHGNGRVRLLSGIFPVQRSDVVLIGRGVFHATENTGAEPLALVEVETPRNKFDLVRARDSFGRAATPYRDPPSSTVVAPPMLEAPLVSDACYRQRCASGQSSFEVVRGYGVFGYETATLCAVLSLAVGDAVRGKITIVDPSRISQETIDKRGVYLTISRST